MQQVDFRDSVVFNSSRGADSMYPCPRRSNSAARGRPVVFARPRPAAAPAFPDENRPPAETGARRSESDGPSSSAAAERRPLTEEALRQRIERVLVEMTPDKNDDDDDGEDSKVAAALRQAIVDSAAFPALFTD